MKVTAQIIVSGTGSIKEIRAEPGIGKDLFVIYDVYNNAVAIDAAVAYLGLECLAKTRGLEFLDYVTILEGVAKDMLGAPLDEKEVPQPPPTVADEKPHYTAQLPLFPEKKEDENVPNV
jgi:hypothetical protein